MALSGNCRINQTQLDMVLYYQKLLTEENDLITIMALASDLLSQAFVQHILEMLLKEYTERYSSQTNFEFKIKMREMIEQEEAHLLSVMNSYGSLEGDIGETRQILSENIERVLQRGESLDSLMNKTALLTSNAGHFRRKTTAVRRKFLWANIRFWVVAVAILLVVVYLIVGSECGFPLYDRCFR